MAFVKVLKNAAYFKRFQVARRRRREGKTDYHARRKMVRQDKNKFNNRKYRLVVRFSNRRCICQCAYATLRGDVVVAAASSNELAGFGIPAGHKNYAAAYATGLLLARRVLKRFGLDEKFKGKEELDGEDYHIEDEDNEQRPFKCILDVGIRRTCVGHRMWGALKGAVDGGLHIPHSTKNFPGFKAADEKGGESEYDAEAHKEKIFGNHARGLDCVWRMLQESRSYGTPRYATVSVQAEGGTYVQRYVRAYAHPPSPTIFGLHPHVHDMTTYLCTGTCSILFPDMHTYTHTYVHTYIPPYMHAHTDVRRYVLTYLPGIHERLYGRLPPEIQIP